MRTGLEHRDRITERGRMALSGLALLALLTLYLCSRSTEIGLISPLRAGKNLWIALELKGAELLKLPLWLRRWEIIEATPYYLETLTRLEGAVTAVVLGATLSVAGAVYQSVFRNPIATPGMLGVSSGISLSNLVLVLRYSNAVLSMTDLRFACGYLFSLGLLGLVLLCGKLMGKRRSSVTDILLAGTVVTRLSGHVVTTVQTYFMGEDDVLLYQEMNLYGTGIGNNRGALFLALALLLGLLPVYLLRFSLNAASFPDDEARCMGVNPTALRYAGLVFSTILVVAAQIHCGDVALLALLVPHVCRRIFGSDTRALLPGCVLWGGTLMLLCRAVVALFAFHRALSVISMSTIVNLIGAPLMICVMLRHRRGWS